MFHLLSQALPRRAVAAAATASVCYATWRATSSTSNTVHAQASSSPNSTTSPRNVQCLDYYQTAQALKQAQKSSSSLEPLTLLNAAAASIPATSVSSSATTPSASTPRTLLIPSANESISGAQPSSSDPVLPMTDSECARCDEWKQKAIHQSRKVNYMFRAMKRAGCTVDPLSFIQCVSCGPTMSGAMMHGDDGRVQILMCGNGRVRSWDHFETVLTHELIHAYDHCRAEIDLTNLKHHACTEIRAANLSGDCSFKRELKLGNLDIHGHQPHCVRRKAVLSLLANPECDGIESAKKAVESVFDRCITDTEPFGSVPW